MVKSANLAIFSVFTSQPQMCFFSYSCFVTNYCQLEGDGGVLFKINERGEEGQR